MHSQSSYFFWLLLTLLFLSCSSSPPPKVLPELRFRASKKVTADFKQECTLYYHENGNHLFTMPGKIKRRGGLSMRYHKWSFAFNIESKIPLAGLPRDDDWILTSCYIDKTFMRHKLAYDLFQQMDPRNIAPRSTYVNVYLHEKFRGLYLLSERLDASTLRIQKGTSAGAMIFKGPDIFRDSMTPPQYEDNYYHQKYPKIEKRDYSPYIKTFRDFLLASSDSLFNAEIKTWISFDNFIDWHLLLLFTNNTDGVCKNYYLYKENKRSPFKIAIWDYDHGYGRDGDNEYNMPDKMMAVNQSILLRRLLKLNSHHYKDRLHKRWEELQEKDILTKKNVLRLIKANDKIIQLGLKQNTDIWPIDSRWYYDDNSYEKEIDLIKRYFNIRIKQMRERLVVEGKKSN